MVNILALNAVYLAFLYIGQAYRYPPQRWEFCELNQQMKLLNVLRNAVQSPCRPWFIARPAHVRFAMYEVAEG